MRKIEHTSQFRRDYNRESRGQHRTMNLTLSVDEQIVERARTTAAAMGLSLNQAVRDYLSELAGQSSPEADIAQVEQLSLVAGGNRRGWRFNRDELHERA